jgi:hypothetical protein
MSRALLLLLLLIASPMAAYADISVTTAHGGTSEKDGEFIDGTINQYDQLAQYYNSGSATMPTFAELAGWHTGRCYSSRSPAVATNSLLALAERSTNDGRNDGPLFPPGAPEQVILTLNNGSERETYFDVVSDAQAISFSNVIFNSLPSMGTAGTFPDGSLGSINTRGNLEYRIKKTGGYFIGRHTLIAAQGGQAAGDAYQYCYWFNRVR